MKKILAFVFLAFLLVGCKQKTNPELAVLFEAVQSSTKMIEEKNQHSMRGFEAMHLENPVITKKIYDLVWYIQEESYSLLEEIEPDSVASETAIQLYEVFKNKVSNRLIYDIKMPHDTIDLLKNRKEMKALIANRVVTFKAIVFDEIKKNISWCGPDKMVVYGENIYTENDSTIVELEIYFPTYKIGLTKLAVEQNNDSVFVEGALKVDSKFGTLRFPKLPKGKYEVNGMLEFSLTNGLVVEENLYCRFEVE